MIKKTSLLIIAIFLLAGCKGFTTEKHPITNVDIYKGTDALKMDFLKNAPPKEVFEDTLFKAAIELRNNGAFDIKSGYLTLTLEDDYVSIDEWPVKKPLVAIEGCVRMIFELEGKSLINTEGDYDITEITLKAKKMEKDELSETHATSILATACYAYQPKATETVCIDTDIHKLRGMEKACAIDEKGKSLASQGAPVAITKIETEMLPKDDNSISPHFIIQIKNKGNGVVIGYDKVREACSYGPIQDDDFNRVEVKVYLSKKDKEGEEGKQLDCDPELEGINAGKARLKDNKEDSIRSVLDEGIDKNLGTYSTPLYIELNYGYTSTISEEVTIKKILSY